MKKSIKKSSMARKFLYYMINVISEYNEGRATCLA